MSAVWLITLSAALAAGDAAEETSLELMGHEAEFVVAAFTLEDQFRETTEYDPPKGRPHIVFIADRHSGYDTVKWYLRFEKEFGDRIDYYGIGALDEIPRIFRPMVRPFLRRQVDKPILLDWDNRVSEALQYEAGTPNVLLVAADGSVLARVLGKMDDTAYETCCSVLAPLIEEETEVPPLARRDNVDDGQAAELSADSREQ